ncbi:ABC transporter permease [Chitinophaga cymbidii]|uniref:ABC transporter permease n=1 Tax=Chitinophaga cymbidii TaxID=1096750 RepID=A0A512RRX4_9BACT|nr:ABC transporter permease [Chitinophaga cymbidii]GEP98432.1 ABC transporter permease [Chitinophaga cymbidii]
MLQNYIKIAWRNIRKSRFYSALNIAGLATGIAFAMLIMAYVWSELQVNASLKNADNQYVLQSDWKDPNMGPAITSVGALPRVLKEQYPTLVKNYYRWDGITSNVSLGDKSFREGLQVGDSTFLEMYGFAVLHGNPRTALQDPYSLVLTDEKALKYFGRTDVTGQSLNIENFAGDRHAFMITAVIKVPGRNSVTSLVDHRDSDGFFLSLEALPFFGRNLDNWTNTSIPGFLELQDGVDAADLEKPMAALLKTNTAAQISDNLHPYAVSLKNYYREKDNGLVNRMLYTLSAIALFILLMAVINFVNMSVSRSSSRMKEIGVRKVLGGLRKQLIWQFLTESAILVTLSAILGFVVFLFVKPVFSQILGKPIPSPAEFPLWFIAFPLALIVVTGLAAGLYPAFVLSSLRSVDSLKGKASGAKENVWLRKSLVAFQFFTAAVVLTGAFIISKQVQLFFSNQLGYNKDYIVSAQLPRDWTPEGTKRMETLRDRFAAMPELKNVSLSYEIPNGNNGGSLQVYRASADSTTATPSLMLATDEYYADTYGIAMAAGMFFHDPGMLTGPGKVVINETLARTLGWKVPADAVGQRVRMHNSASDMVVAGVTKDFHFSSMQEAVQPMIFLHVSAANVFRYFSFKLKGNGMAALERKWAEIMPGAPFEYTFMDDTLARIYQTEIQLKQAAYTATILALVIVLLGVTGMISLSIRKRTKEIGVRKVLGASVSGIVGLFVKEFMVVIAVAGLIAAPVAYVVMQRWLADYAYRIHITAAPFVITIVLLAVITTVLIVLQTVKAALANPVNSLRTE